MSPTSKGLRVEHNDKTSYNRFLLLVAGLGGLLYGVDWALSQALCRTWRLRRV